MIYCLLANSHKDTWAERIQDSAGTWKAKTGRSGYSDKTSDFKTKVTRKEKITA